MPGSKPVKAHVGGKSDSQAVTNEEAEIED